MKNKEILENIKDLELENKSLKTDRIILYSFLFTTIFMGFFESITNYFDSQAFTFALVFMALLSKNKNIIDKNTWAIETLNKIIGVETEDKESGENDENTNN